MQFPSLEFVEALQDKLNVKSEFNEVTKWSDVKILLAFGDSRYYLKLYGGKIIDVREYTTFSVPLGWDYAVSGSLETWQDYVSGKKPLRDLISFGLITIDGNLLEAHRMFEGTHQILEAIAEIK